MSLSLQLNAQFSRLTVAQSFPTSSIRCKSSSPLLRQNPKSKSSSLGVGVKATKRAQDLKKLQTLEESSDGYTRYLLISGVSVGLMMVLVLGIDVEKAMALGPEGPLMEEFWDNVRRYGLYALTVSTGALSAVFEPIFELLKNPISAVLILIILGGSFFIVSQVLNAMIGVSEFAYDYGY